MYIEKMSEKEVNNNKGRTLSEDFFSRSPATQYYIKSLVGTIPTSRDSPIRHSNVDVYYAASPNTKQNMVIYGLVPPTMLRK
jgi:hypothetical protein